MQFRRRKKRKKGSCITYQDRFFHCLKSCQNWLFGVVLNKALQILRHYLLVYSLIQGFPTSLCMRATCYIDRYFAGHVHRETGLYPVFSWELEGRCSIFKVQPGIVKEQKSRPNGPPSKLRGPHVARGPLVLNRWPIYVCFIWVLTKTFLPLLSRQDGYLWQRNSAAPIHSWRSGI
jgi:hypothetical protein